MEFKTQLLTTQDTQRCHRKTSYKVKKNIKRSQVKRIHGS